MLNNINSGSTYCLSCIVCGTIKAVHLTSHRNDAGQICGFIVACDECQLELSNGKLTIEKPAPKQDEGEK